LLGLIFGCGTWSPNAPRLRYTRGVPRLTQRSISHLPLRKTPVFGDLVELWFKFYIRQRPHYVNLADYAGYWVCTVTTKTGVTVLCRWGTFAALFTGVFPPHVYFSCLKLLSPGIQSSSLVRLDL